MPANITGYRGLWPAVCMTKDNAVAIEEKEKQNPLLLHFEYTTFPPALPSALLTVSFFNTAEF